MRAWTYVYNPFVMGGNTHRAKGFEFEGVERVELGKGYYGYTLQSPNGKSIVVEEHSGAIIGNSLEDVRNDIDQGDSEVMKKQVEKACKEVVIIISESEFWSLYK
jgi:hypothetical protein